jgi:phosphate transport system permease protein
VGVFLFAVALPLFRSARIAFEHATPLAHDPAAASALGTDETGAVGWLLDGGGDAGGRLRLFGTADGASLLDRDANEVGLAGATAIRVQPTTLQAVVGFADGSVRTGRLGLESSFLAAADLPADLGRLQLGEVRRSGDSVILRGGNDRHARIRLVAEFAGEPSRALDGRIVDVDVTQASGGPLVAALDAQGRVRVEAITSRRNLLTDEIVTESSGTTIEPPARDAAGTARFVRVSELGDQLFVIDEEGTARRHAIRSIEEPVLMETFDVAPGPAKVTAVARLFGGNALAVGDSAGAVRIYFTTRADAGAAADGLRMAAATTFPAARDAAITALAASPRSRLIAAADASGRIRLLQSTACSTVLSVDGREAGGLSAPAELLLVSPRENRLLAADARGIGAWAFDPGYPEISFRGLFGRVWYENYPGAVHAWETTGHESFEAKFGLVPLIFGTLKATLYSMLFATPIAILAAIYSSQFLHPRWKARVKPTIEMMASLPSVVLGFIAGLVFAPLVEPAAMAVITGFFTVPLALLFGAHLWQLLPSGWRSLLAAWRLPVIALVALPAGVIAARLGGPLVERLLFQGDFRGWLDGRGGSGLGGWVLALLPLAGIAAAMICGRFVSPWLRRKAVGWSRGQAALASLGTFLAARHPQRHLRNLRATQRHDRRHRHELRHHPAGVHDRRRRALERARPPAERVVGRRGDALADCRAGHRAGGGERTLFRGHDRAGTGRRRDDGGADGCGQHAAHGLEPVQRIPDALRRDRHGIARGGPRQRALPRALSRGARALCHDVRRQHRGRDRQAAFPEEVA